MQRHDLRVGGAQKSAQLALACSTGPTQPNGHDRLPAGPVRPGHERQSIRTGLWLLFFVLARVAEASAQSLLPAFEGTAKTVYARVLSDAQNKIQPLGGEDVRVVPMQPEKWQRLPACPAEATLSLAGLRPSGKSILRVACRNDTGATHWNRELTVEVQFFITVVQSARAISQGERFSASNTALVKHPYTSLRSGFFSELAALQEAVAGRALKAGEIIRPGLLRRKVMFKRGAIVSVVADSATVRVSTEAVALNAGYTGDRVKVERADGRVIDCIVTGPHEVRPARLPPEKRAASP